MKHGILILECVDDCNIIADSEARKDVLTHSFFNVKEKYISTEEGLIDKFLCISISELDDNQYELLQLFLIERIVEFIEN